MYYVVQITTSLAALDEDASDFLRYPDGAVFLIRRHMFLNDLVAGATLFKMPYKVASATYVTQDFVEAVDSARLTGFAFHQVWDGERPVEGPFGGW